MATSAYAASGAASAVVSSGVNHCSGVTSTAPDSAKSCNYAGDG